MKLPSRTTCVMKRLAQVKRNILRAWHAGCALAITCLVRLTEVVADLQERQRSLHLLVLLLPHVSHMFWPRRSGHANGVVTASMRRLGSYCRLHMTLRSSKRIASTCIPSQVYWQVFGGALARWSTAVQVQGRQAIGRPTRALHTLPVLKKADSVACEHMRWLECDTSMRCCWHCCCAMQSARPAAPLKQISASITPSERPVGFADVSQHPVCRCKMPLSSTRGPLCT